MALLSTIRRWRDDHPWQLAGIVFAFLLLIAWIVRADFAMSMDEPPLFAYGLQAWDYLFNGGPVPPAADWRFHTPLYQFVFIWLAKHLPSDGMLIFGVSRFVSFLVFSIGWWSLYALARRLTGSHWWALGTVVCLTLSPRMFAHAFYNPKDIPTFAFFTLGVLLLARLMEKRSALRVVLFGLVTGFAISLRPFSLLLPAFAALWFGLDWLRAPAREKRPTALWGLATLAAVLLLTIVVWPRLWSDPIGGLAGAIFDNTSRSDEGFYLGTHYDTRFPWHYLPVWMVLTVPLAYSALFLSGLGFAAWELRRPKRFLFERPLLLVALLWIGLPVLAKMLGRIGLFDEWRHLLFIYSAFLLIAVFGAKRLWETLGTWPRRIAVALVALNMAATLVWMVRWHPFEYLYFSVPSALVKGEMEMDYWGLSYVEGLRWIAANDQSARIPVYIRNDVGVGHILMLPPADQARLYAVKSSAQALYILDTLRWTHYEPSVPEDRLLHVVTADGLPVMWVYRGPFQTDKLPDYK